MDPALTAQVADEVFANAKEIVAVPGISYGVLRDGALVHVAGRGTAWLDGPTPDADTVFRIASMTKSFTAQAVLALRDEGALRLDDLLVDHLPEAKGICALDGPPITIRDLLTMGAGLATDDPWGDRQEPLPVEEFDALVAQGLSFCRPSRTAFEYSNTGYALLGRVITRVTGVAYTDFVTRRILTPLGMTSSRFDARQVPVDRLAVGYRVDSSGAAEAQPFVPPGAYSAMGGLHSTVNDLSRWVSSFFSAWSTGLPDHPLNQWSLREAQEMARYASMEHVPDADVVVHGYGFGLMIEEHETLGRVVAHSGGYPGFGSHMRWHPGSGWGVIALGNGTYANMRAPASVLLSRLVLESGQARGAKPSIPPLPWLQTLQAMDVAEELLRGSDAEVNSTNWSPNMDLDIPRAERLAVLADVRDAIGNPRRVVDSVEFPTPARALWTVTGDAGSAKLDLLMTPERSPRIQKLTATRVKD
jgi:CubicO group peptidase (beta-lactamase class C family)